MKPLFAKVAQAVSQAPVPYVGDGARRLQIFSGRNNTERQLQAMGSVGTLFGIVHRTSNALAQVNWRLYRETPDPAIPADRVEVFAHPILDLINKPNPFFTGHLFRETCQQHADLVGETVWIVGRAPGYAMPLELWPVRPDKIEPIPHPQKFISGWVYTGPSGERIPFTNDEIIQMKLPNPEDFYRGMGPVQALLNDIDAERFSAEWNRQFFQNSAQPGGLISVGDKRLDDDEFDELNRRWNEGHKGINRAHRVAFLENGAQWIPNAFTQQDMQFAQLRLMARDKMLEAFGFPKSALGIVEDVNRANADAGDAWFDKHLTVERAHRWKDTFNSMLLPLYGSLGEGYVVDFDSPVEADREADNAERDSKAQSFLWLVQAGVDPDDAALVVGLPPMRHTGVVHVGAGHTPAAHPALAGGN